PTRYQLDIAAPEDPVENRAYEYLGREAAAAYGALSIECAGTCLPIIFQHRPVLVLIEFLERHGGGRPVRHVAHAFTNGIIQRRVDFKFQVKPVGVHEEERRFITRA